MRIPKTLLIIVFWIGILLAYTAAQTLLDMNSRDLWLRPIPIDPRDMFRGEYVQLHYDFSLLKLDKIIDRNQQEESKLIYAVLKEDQEVYILDHFSLVKPSDSSVFLRGTPVGSQLFEGLLIRYNLESWFVPEGQGPELERNIGDKLKVKIRVNPWGWARIIEISTD